MNSISQTRKIKTATLRDVLRDMVHEVTERWDRDRQKLDDDIEYASIEEVIDEVFEEYME